MLFLEEANGEGEYEFGKIEIEKEGMDFSAEDSPERASDMQWQD